ncbi:MAG: DNA polymerase III subunit epsilon [Candidatus Nitrotoga sp.]|nr:DNA polymerase III subunit epsilon [Candidatus Nitrotoga sp.]RFC39976.1 MAG: DNA polymerase-3 subunit epsilon [Candidatus Nitrotoga sp. CP45]MDO9448038.1 DNA polymerase III subunit epsilon [Candidatus Nitrotoga sp.]MDP1639174.1 DNA polymerase III subunit epsilon [Candidatus Nitrotoga sp.]MDP1854458.1 DNA polymerase III subunit epsilon [Candidatus Nitrotoga sp.]
MRQIVLDTETTGLDPGKGHRIIELAAIELCNRKVSDRRFHRYLNPEREIDAGAAEVHGLTLERLQDEPKFAEIAPALLEFISGAELIIHNAPFDIGFLNKELELTGLPALNNYCVSVIDTLKLAKELHPGKKNNLNALCDRYQIDNSHRTLHGALLDTELLAEVYLSMTRGQKSLLDDGSDKQEEEPIMVFADLSRLKLRVLPANDDELAQHAQQLADIDKASKGACMWKQLELLEV